ncbi:hypothetical protein F7725_005134 [Dissostichus mawsoni]|uniref:Signal peptidase complex subunit 3 n=1 Tax=Dissostichus mawsoni TaxID=36200 RepID=A0A7J5YSV9_DISMA|nr:hypothetical protein F7725_005134 [Dissostichus mawsoni]
MPQQAFFLSGTFSGKGPGSATLFRDISAAPDGTSGIIQRLNLTRLPLINSVTAAAERELQSGERRSQELPEQSDWLNGFVVVVLNAHDHLTCASTRSCFSKMNTVLSRANSLFAFSLSVMAALTFGCFVTTAFKDRRVPVDIHVSKPIFDWNVKQLFLYLSAEYATRSNALNQVVLWDKIVLRGENTKLNLRDVKSKYFFFDDGNGLRANKNITLTLSWNVVPNAGILPLVAGSGQVSLPFPESYETTKSY